MSSDFPAIRAQLATLLTPIAPVRTGLSALETTSATLPVIVLWSTGDALASDQGYRAAAYTRSVILEYRAAASDTWDADLDQALHRIRQALRPYIGQPILPDSLALRETGVRFFSPDLTAQGFSPSAALQLSLDIDYLERT